MFDFITKLFSGRNEAKSESSLARDAKSTQNGSDDQSLSKHAGEKQRLLEQQRQMWKQKLDAAINNEAMVLEMLLSCDFADGRFHAAQYVHSKHGLEQVREAFKKSDKRVTKLMQSKLDAIADQERNQHAAQQCVEAASSLLDLAYLLPNQLVELDAQRQALKTFPDSLLAQFQTLRQQLELRISEQVDLQRRLLNLILEIEAALKADDPIEARRANEKQQIWQELFDACCAHQLASSLPKHAVQDAVAALAKHQAKIVEWGKRVQQDQIATPEASANAIAGTVELAEPKSDQDKVLVSTIESPRNEVPTPTSSLSLAQFTEALDGLEHALQEGSFQQARSFEKHLRDIDLNAGPKYLSRQQKDRLSQARKQFNHLLSWAKWSGDASREELVNTAEGLAHLKLAPNDIVDTVAALRAQWKQMEATSGGAPKELWLRFDAACSAAYAPAAAHFQQQAELRKSNVIKAEQKLNAMRAGVEDLLQTEKNWKAIGLAIVQMQQDWKKSGPFERKEKARLDQQFSEILHPLTQVFDAERELAVQARQSLIEEAKAIDPGARNAADQLRSLQTRWQSSASHIALERKQEQELWLAFRHACDAVFEARKQFAASADQERQQNLQQKFAVCDKLEQFVTGEISLLKQFRQQIQVEWSAIGAVPRQEEAQLQARFEKAMAYLQEQLNKLELDAQNQRVQGILHLLETVQKAEAVLTEHVVDEPTWQALSQELAKLDIPKNRAGRHLKQRWESLLQLSVNRSDELAPRRVLLGNALEADHLILSLEILLQLDSPARLLQERRKTQLEILQQSMKNGKGQDQVKMLLGRLFSLTVAFDLERQDRVRTIAQHTTQILLAP